jgi:hypothetical protein
MTTTKLATVLLGTLTTACMGASRMPMAASSTSPSAAYSSGGGDYTPVREAPSPVPDRPGLGTTWGERVDQPIRYTPFTRASNSPWAEIALHYNDAEGVDAHARYLGRPTQPVEVFTDDGAVGMSLVDESGRELPGIAAGDKSLIVGHDGERYKIVVRNSTDVRFEIVASVDGLDVVDGKPADPSRRGYLVDPHGTLVIDGFRTSDAEVAAFRFGKVADSYAAQTSGDRNVGVIGFAVFAERGSEWSRHEIGLRDTADPFPARGYAQPPR